MANIYVTREIPEGGLKMLREKFGTFDMNPDDRVLSREELLKNVQGRDAVLSLLTDKIDDEIFSAAGPQCKIFSSYAVGFNNIDLNAATKHGVMITNTPGVLTDATADLAISLLFAASRRIVESDTYLRAGKFKGWGPLHFLGQDIPGKILGIIGAGRIGANVATKMAKGFGMKVIYADTFKNEALEKDIGARQVDMEELFKTSDFISVHVNLTPETTHLINEKSLGMMKSNCVLINTSRGPVVDENALVVALKNKVIFAAGLDVFEKEPELAPGLIDLPNAVLVPHIASATLWTRTRMAEIAAQNLIDALEGRTPQYLVNPDVKK